MSDRKWFTFRRRLSDNGDTEKTELKSANDNPWYCLATVHGEQPIGQLDQEIAEKNRAFWERWINAGMDAEQRKELQIDFTRRITPGSFTLPEPQLPIAKGRGAVERLEMAASSSAAAPQN
jgi:hypothetical protein